MPDIADHSLDVPASGLASRQPLAVLAGLTLSALALAAAPP